MKPIKLIKQLIILTFLISISLGKNSFAKGKDIQGTVSIDGSSTVFPIAEAVAEEFRSVMPKIKVNIGVSGTGGGFKKFVSNETDINNASRPIKEQEAAKAQTNKVDYLEVPIAYDGLTVVINKENTWAKNMTVAELKKIWEAGSKVKTWSDIRPEWPNREIKLFGPGTDSGTFDYFTETINGKSGSVRSDFQKSEDDNVLVTGVTGNKDAMAFFGYAYFLENQDKIQAIAIDNGKGSIAPTEVTINDGTYAPLSRMIYVYVNKNSLKKPEVYSYLEFMLNKAPELVKEVGYIPLQNKLYKEWLAKLKK